MSGNLSFLDVSGREVANSYRTRGYMLFGLTQTPKWTLNGLGCAILGREVGGLAPFVSPSHDPAPWYSAAYPESAEFLGFYVTELDFQTPVISRTVSQRFGSLGGGVIGSEIQAARGVYVKGWLIAASCPGMEYGRHWLYSQLGADCDGCTLDTIRVRDSCPPTDGSNDTRGEWIIYDAALVDGIKRTGNPGWPCCDWDEIEFSLAGESPYLYKRPGAATAPVAFATTGGIFPPVPAVLDSGTRANTGPPPSASWTNTGLGTFTGSGLKIVSNAFVNNDAALPSMARWNAATFAADQVVYIDIPNIVRAAGNGVGLVGALSNPGTGSAACVVARILLGGSSGAAHDTNSLIHYTANGATTFTISNDTTLRNAGTLNDWAAGDRAALLLRGSRAEIWRRRASVWSLVAGGYDPTARSTGAAGAIIYSPSGQGQTFTNFGAAALTNPYYPLDPVAIQVPSVPVGVTSPIVTLSSGGGAITDPPLQEIRIQEKAICGLTDDFALDDLLTSWYDPGVIGTDWRITGGKLNPKVLTPIRLYRSFTGGVPGAGFSLNGGRVQIDITTGGTITNGEWTIGFSGGGYASLRATSNLFMIPDDSVGGASIVSTAFTPAINTTYRLICECTRGATQTTVRAWLVDPATNLMLTSPLTATFTSLPPTYYIPVIGTDSAAITDAWDSFQYWDYGDEPGYIDVTAPFGVVVIDASRRVSSYTAYGSATSVDASAYISTPVGTPIFWPDVCSPAAGCIQIFSDLAEYPSATVSVALQNRQR